MSLSRLRGPLVALLSLAAGQLSGSTSMAPGYEDAEQLAAAKADAAYWAGRADARE